MTLLRLAAMATGTLLVAVRLVHAGPCTAQIARLQEQVAMPSPLVGPTAPQTLGAQLHHQPTPEAVQHAERSANTDAEAAVERARKADAAGDADSCERALREARHLYGVD
jgi:negative regulator of sigma E activity